MNARVATSVLFVWPALAALTLRAAAADDAPAGEPQARASHVVDVADDAALRRALAEAKPGWRIVLAPGRYRPGVYAAGLRGTREAPIVIEAADPADKPLFEGGKLGLQFSDCEHLVVRNLALRGQSGNGINVDDGGTPDTPARHVTLEGLDVADTGPRGNCDAIKLSGLEDFAVRRCVVAGWGGQGVDMVGCHRGLIDGCTFTGKDGFDQHSAVQIKGGSAAVTVRRCTFLRAGHRGVNVGGATGPGLFRPADARYEAKDLTVEGCRFAGGMAAVAFVGVDGATVRYNTIYRPDKWVLRILQENTGEGMVRCRNGRFERNLVVFRRAQVRAPANVGPNTEPGSFTFRDNFWYCEDNPAASRPDLPVAERGGVYGTDPDLAAGRDGAPAAPAAPEAKGFGAAALPSPGRSK